MAIKVLKVDRLHYAVGHALFLPHSRDRLIIPHQQFRVLLEDVLRNALGDRDYRSVVSILPAVLKTGSYRLQPDNLESLTPWNWSRRDETRQIGFLVQTVCRFIAGGDTPKTREATPFLVASQGPQLCSGLARTSGPWPWRGGFHHPWPGYVVL